MSQLPAFLPPQEPCPTVQPWEVYHELQRIRPRTAPGPDAIPAHLVREFALELSTPLTNILNASYEHSKCVLPTGEMS